MHGDVSLGGPVWFAATVLILGGVVLSLFVFIDSVRPKRRAAAADRLPEPLWLYTVLTGAFLASLIVVQFLPGLQVAAAIPAIATPFMLAIGIVYLLRVVYPKPRTFEE